jgi:hypothetical protein
MDLPGVLMKNLLLFIGVISAVACCGKDRASSSCGAMPRALCWRELNMPAEVLATGTAIWVQGEACWYQDYMLPKGWLDEDNTPWPGFTLQFFSSILCLLLRRQVRP